MRHLKAGRTLGRNAAHRLALFRNLSRALIEHGRIVTTVEKAKELRPFVEKLVTLAKKGTLHHRRLALAKLPDKKAVAKLFNDIGPRFADRPGILWISELRHHDKVVDAVLIKIGYTTDLGTEIGFWIESIDTRAGRGPPDAEQVDSAGGQLHHIDLPWRVTVHRGILAVGDGCPNKVWLSIGPRRHVIQIDDNIERIKGVLTRGNVHGLLHAGRCGHARPKARWTNQAAAIRTRTAEPARRTSGT